MRKCIFPLSLLFLLVLIPTALAIPSPKEVAVPETHSAIIIDGVLNMSNEWNSSTIIVWYNPIIGNELDRVYLLHNSTHYFIGGIFYDPDNKKDDAITFYVDWGTIYKYEIDEDSTCLCLYNGTHTLSSNGTAKLTKSSPFTYWIYLEVAIPKSEWHNADTVRMYFEHLHTHRVIVKSRYPEDANSTDSTKWLTVVFKQVLGEYNVTIHFKDRDHNDVDYIANNSYATIRFSNGSLYTTVAPTNSSISVLLPPDNYTITFYVYDILTFNTTLSVNSNITVEYILNNLKYVEMPYGRIIAVVEIPSNIEGIYLKPEKQLGMLISNSTTPTALRIFPQVSWNWNYTFTVVLNAINFTYNPLTRHLLAFSDRNLTGIMMIGAPEGYPVFYFANGTVRGYIYDDKLKELNTWISNGSYGIFSQTLPFAVVLNNTALRKGIDYTVDPFNITFLTIDEGNLRIYFKNPIKVSISFNNNTADIIITTPYSFNGYYTLYIYSNTTLVYKQSGTFTSTVPLTTIKIPLRLKSGEYTALVKVIDKDSQQTVGEASASYTVAQIPTVNTEKYYCIILLLILVVIVLSAILSKQIAKALLSTDKRKYLKIQS